MTLNTKLRTNFIYPLKSIFKAVTIEQWRYFLFLVIPVIYLLITYVAHVLRADFYLGNVDPEYFHLYNGIAIANGNLAVGYTAHPGTPLQYMIAVSARIIHIFQGNDDFIKDFIDNPEKYIHAANLFQNLLTTIVLFFGTIYIFRITRSIIVGLIFQLIPLGNYTLIGLTSRILPETFMVLPLLFIFLLSLKYIFTDSISYNIKSNFLLWGIVIGFGIAIKLSFIPVILFPLIAIKSSWKNKILYSLYLFLSVIIFAYPIIVNFREFFNWVFSLFIHSGMYGHGEKNVVDLSNIAPNFSYMYHDDKILFLVMLLSVLSVFLLFFKNKITNYTRAIKIAMAIIASNVTILFAIALTLKNFKFYYFMPFYTFKFFLIILIFLLIYQFAFIQNKRLKLAYIIVIVFSILSILNGQRSKIGQDLHGFEERTKQLENNRATVLNLVDENSVIIQSGPYFGTPFLSYAQNSGFLMTYNLKNIFKPYLLEKYPNSFFYYDWTEKFYHFDDYADFQEILAKVDTDFYVYTGPEMIKNLQPVEQRIYKVISSEKITRERIYFDKTSEESL